MPEQNFPRFRGLLRSAICTRTQAQFALESGISAEHLNRMLNQDTIGRPSKQTLHKIAAAAKNGITYKILQDALEGDDPTGKKEDNGPDIETCKNMSDNFHKQAHTTMRTLHRVLENQIAYKRSYESLNAVIENIMKLLASQPNAKSKLLPVSYEIYGSYDYINPDSNADTNIEKWTSVVITMANYQETATSEMLIFWRPINLANQEWYDIIKVSTDIMDIMDVQGMPPAAFNSHKDLSENKAFEAALADDYYLEFAKFQRYVEKFYDANAKSKEEAFLNSLIGVESKYTKTTDGFGFWLPETPEKLGKFLQTHKDEILAEYTDEPEVQKQLGNIIDTGDNEKIKTFLDAMNYNDNYGASDAGYGAAIALVMYHETGFPYRYRRHTTPEDNTQGFTNLSEHDCIIISEKNVDKYNIRRDTLINATCSLAFDIGIKTLGDIIFTQVTFKFRKPHTYRLKLEQNEPNTTTEPKQEYNYSVNMATGVMPDITNLYAVELKDGRHLKLIYLKEVNAWVMWHKEWSYLIKAYDPTPLKPDGPDKPEETDSTDK